MRGCRSLPAICCSVRSIKTQAPLPRRYGLWCWQMTRRLLFLLPLVLGFSRESRAGELPRATRVRCDLILATATAIAKSPDSQLCGWMVTQNPVTVSASECLNSEWCSPVIQRRHIYSDRSFEVYQRGTRSKRPHPTHVLSLLFTKWRGNALVFSAYIRGWPEGETASQIALCGSASGTVKKVGSSWEVTVDTDAPEASKIDSQTDAIPSGVQGQPKTDSGTKPNPKALTETAQKATK